MRLRTTGSGADPVKSLGLFADIQHFVLFSACLELGLDQSATFSLFVRRLPPTRNFLVACGLADLLGTLEDLAFDSEDLVALARHPVTPSVLGRLERFRFEGDVYALPEGTPFFAGEPILEIVAPLSQAQLVETLAVNIVGLQTLVASKAARIVGAADGRPVFDFGARGAHGFDAVLKAARAAYIGGVGGTTNVGAAHSLEIPLATVMAHSFVQAMASEPEAFRAYAMRHPDAVLVVDTYDTMRGVRHAVAVARELRDAAKIAAIRIDSGDLLELSRRARNLLDDAGLGAIQVVASGDLDEYAIEALLNKGAPVDAFAVGGALTAPTDAPALDLVYKLTEFAGEGRIKSSPGKRTLPGRKQIFRTFADGRAYSDVVGLFDEAGRGEGLLKPVMQGGRRLGEPEPLAAIRTRCAVEISRLPPELRALEAATRPYPVEISPALLEADRVAREKSARPTS